MGPASFVIKGKKNKNSPPPLERCPEDKQAEHSETVIFFSSFLIRCKKLRLNIPPQVLFVKDVF